MKAAVKVAVAREAAAAKAVGVAGAMDADATADVGLAGVAAVRAKAAHVAADSRRVRSLGWPT